MKKKVLIITSSIDCTVDYVIEKYKLKADFYRFNVDLFSMYEIIVRECSRWTISCNEWSVESREIYSIYYRKPRLPNLDKYEVEYHGMIAKDIISLVNGIVDFFEGKVLTKPYILRKTENKAYQLLYAGKRAFLLPDSFIGNSNRMAEDFSKKKSIIKPLTTGKLKGKEGAELYQTNYFSEFDDDISLTPIYLQKYVNKKYEVRLTVINGKFFTVKIEADDKLDWRKNYNGISYSIIKCPDDIKEKCLALLEEFSLVYGAFDFIVTENEEWIFLEVNPNGQWQWLEQLLKISISEEIVRYLIT